MIYRGKMTFIQDLAPAMTSLTKVQFFMFKKMSDIAYQSIKKTYLMKYGRKEVYNLASGFFLIGDGTEKEVREEEKAFNSYFHSEDMPKDFKRLKNSREYRTMAQKLRGFKDDLFKKALAGRTLHTLLLSLGIIVTFEIIEE